MSGMRYAILSCFLPLLTLSAELPFRTDADGPINQKVERNGKALPWFQLVPGEFPPEHSAHAISGELIQVDHLERKFQLRVDRNDSQDRGVWDLPLVATMLPFGSISYHGAPAAIEDIPLGTHLQGLFYIKDPAAPAEKAETAYNRQTPEYEFQRCFRLEDDFSFQQRQQTFWKVEGVDLNTKKLKASLSDGKVQEFDLLSSTRVFDGAGFAELTALNPGQHVALNLTWVTLYGPGRITDIWVNEAARQLATKRQLERHRVYIRERGLAGWVTKVEDASQHVTVTLFGGVDELLLTEWQNKNVGSGALAVARESLMTYDPVNDRKSGKLLKVEKVPTAPGSSGLQITLKMDMMLEGYRPRHIVRFYPSSWKVIALPREEQFFGRE